MAAMKLQVSRLTVDGGEGKQVAVSQVTVHAQRTWTWIRMQPVGLGGYV